MPSTHPKCHYHPVNIWGRLDVLISSLSQTTWAFYLSFPKYLRTGFLKLGKIMNYRGVPPLSFRKKILNIFSRYWLFEENKTVNNYFTSHTLDAFDCFLIASFTLLFSSYSLCELKVRSTFLAILCSGNTLLSCHMLGISAQKGAPSVRALCCQWR